MTDVLLVYSPDFADKVSQISNQNVTKAQLVKQNESTSNIQVKVNNNWKTYHFYKVGVEPVPNRRFKRFVLLAHGQKVTNNGSYASVCETPTDKPTWADVDYLISASSLLQNIIAPNIVAEGTTASLLLLVCWGGARQNNQSNSYADFLLAKPTPNVRPNNLKYVLASSQNIAAVNIPTLVDEYVKVSNANAFPKLPYLDCKEFSSFQAPTV